MTLNDRDRGLDGTTLFDVEYPRNSTR